AGGAIGGMRSSRWTTAIFHTQEKSRKIDFDENWRLQRLRCVARIKTHSNHPTSVQIKLEVQLVACAAPDGPQQFFIRKKNKEKSILMKIGVCNVCDVWHASKPTPIILRACKSSWRCNWLHAQLPMDHSNFSYARKIKKNRF